MAKKGMTHCTKRDLLCHPYKRVHKQPSAGGHDAPIYKLAVFRLKG